jgi:UDP-2,3-diacylglucosamine pyrophosphatase LpxH
LLILSDVHLGSDLNDLTEGSRRSKRVDADLVNLLRHYSQAPCTGSRWRLVIAGDFIDFIGMAILPRDAELTTLPSAEERAHGLGSAADHSRLKLRAAVARHREVFEALAEFVGMGHALTIVHGNHDVDFHWDAVKDELRAILVDLAFGSSHADASGIGDEGPALGVTGRIEFAPWFYYVGGLAYVEHGHQYDTLCSTEHVMAPLSPLDPRRIARSFSDVLLRWVVRPTRGLKDYGHDKMGLVDYVMLAARLGARGLATLGYRFFTAVIELFRLRRAHLSDAAKALREEHERRMAALAAATRVGLDRLRALAALQVPPVTTSAAKILASVLLDRLAVALAAASCIAVLTFAGLRHPTILPALAAVVAGWWILHGYLTRRRNAWFGEHLDNHDMLAERAGQLARLFPAAFVVMGHTHVPARIPVGEGGATTYVNVGSWHEEEAGPDSSGPGYLAARTHLVIHPGTDEGLTTTPTAEFLTWGPNGPKSFDASAKRGAPSPAALPAVVGTEKLRST